MVRIQFSKVSKQTYFLGTLSLIIPLIYVIKKFNYTILNIKLPLFGWGDELIYAAAAKSFSKGEFLWNGNFSAPFGQNLNFAYLSVDSGPTLLAGIIANLSGNVFLGLNIVYILSFPICALSAFIGLFLICKNSVISFFGALIISMLPFHLDWNTSGITVATYFLLPLLLCLSIMWYRNEIKRGSTLCKFTYLIAFLNGLWYSYYALGYFLIFISFSAGIWFFKSDIKKAINVSILPIISAFGFLLCSIPALIAKYSSVGINYFAERDAWASIVNATTLLHYITPYPGSLEDLLINKLTNQKWSAVHLMNLMNPSGLFGEGWKGTVPWGLIILALLSYRARARGKFQDAVLEKYDFVSAILILSLLWSLVGGLGSIFSIAITSILRGFARYSIFVLISIVILVSLYLSSLAKKEKLLTISILAITSLGLLLNPPSIKAGNSQKIVDSVSQVESEIGVKQGCSILLLPFMHFPYESPGYPTYRQLKFGLISDKYRWSAGAVGGSPEYAKMSPLKSAQKESILRLIQIAKTFNYCGILLDEQTWNSVAEFKPWEDFEPQISSLAKLEPQLIEWKNIQTADGKYLWLQLM